MWFAINTKSQFIRYTYVDTLHIESTGNVGKQYRKISLLASKGFEDIFDDGKHYVRVLLTKHQAGSETNRRRTTASYVESL